MHNEGNDKQGEKAAFRIEENNSKWNNSQRINLQNIQTAHAVQYHKTKQPSQKVGKKAKQTIPPKKTCTWLTNTCKDAQHHSLLEKYKSKPQWGISCESKWTSSKSL